MQASSGGGTGRGYWFLLSALTLLHVVPLWLTPFNPLSDVPFHLSRIYVIHNYDRIPVFNQNLELALYPMPNLALDLLGAPLLEWLDAVVVGKLILSTGVVLMALGCHLLSVQYHSRPVSGAPLALFFVFNTFFVLGFVNYIFALCLFPLILALWVRWRYRWNFGRWLAVAALTMLAYLSHLSIFVLLAVAYGVHAAWDWWEHRKVTRSQIAGLSVVVPSVLLHLYPWPGKLPLSGFIWGGPFDKASGLAGPLISYDLFLAGGYAIALAVIGGLAWKYGIWKANQPGLATAAVFIVLFFLCPKGFYTTFDADRRAVPVAYALAAVAVDVRLRAPWRKALLVAVVSVGAARCLELTLAWRRMSVDTVDVVRIMDHVEPGTRVYPIVVIPENRIANRMLVGNNSAYLYALIYRHALTSGSLWAPFSHPVYYRRLEDWPWDFMPAQKVDVERHARAIPKFDYVYGFNLNAEYESFLKERATLIARRGLSTVWKPSPPTGPQSRQ